MTKPYRKPEKANPSGLRENLELEYQINEQLRAVRWAWNMGDKKALMRGIMALKPLIDPWFPKDAIEKYEQITYSPVSLEQLYTPKDKNHLELYGKLVKKRMRSIQKQQSIINQQRFYKSIAEREGLIMDTFKKLGLGFDIEDDAFIDKKKATFLGPKSFKESMRMSMRKKGTGSAPS